MTAEQIRQEEQEQESYRAKMREIAGSFKRSIKPEMTDFDQRLINKAIASYPGREEEATPGGARVFIIKETFRNRERNVRIIVGGLMIKNVYLIRGRIYAMTQDVADHFERAIKQIFEAWEEERRLNG